MYTNRISQYLDNTPDRPPQRPRKPRLVKPPKSKYGPVQPGLVTRPALITKADPEFADDTIGQPDGWALVFFDTEEDRNKFECIFCLFPQAQPIYNVDASWLLDENCEPIEGSQFTITDQDGNQHQGKPVMMVASEKWGAGYIGQFPTFKPEELPPLTVLDD